MIELPFPDVRREALRSPPADFSDLKAIVNTHLHVATEVEKFIGPYNARQRNSQFPYISPSRELLYENIDSCGMQETIFSSYITGIINFCEHTRGMRGLPSPHPSLIHSIQLSESHFKLSQSQKGVTIIELVGVKQPLFVRGLPNANKYKFLVIQQRIGKLGTPSARQWDILFFSQPHGYIPHWIDSNLNTKFSGIF